MDRNVWAHEKMVNLYDQLTTCCKCVSHSHFFYPIFFFLSFLLTNTSTDSLFMRSRPEVFSVINFKWYKVKILYIILLFIFELLSLFILLFVLKGRKIHYYQVSFFFFYMWKKYESYRVYLTRKILGKGRKFCNSFRHKPYMIPTQRHQIQT